MLVEVEHHYGWTLHDEPVDDLFAAACAAVTTSCWEILTPTNHTLEPGPWANAPTEHGGSVRVRTLVRLPQFLGPAIEPGQTWLVLAYRRHFPHGTTAHDRHGRRWAHVSTPGFPHPAKYREGPKPWRRASSKWACIDDPRVSSAEHPHLFADPVAFTLDAPSVTEAEIERARRLVHDAFTLRRLADVAAMRCTPKQAATDLRLRGTDRDRWLAIKAWRLAARMQGDPERSLPASVGRRPDGDLHAAIDLCLQLAGIFDLVRTERAANRSPVRPRKSTAA